MYTNPFDNIFAEMLAEFKAREWVPEDPVSRARRGALNIIRELKECGFICSVHESKTECILYFEITKPDAVMTMNMAFSWEELEYYGIDYLREFVEEVTNEWNKEDE